MPITWKQKKDDRRSDVLMVNVFWNVMYVSHFPHQALSAYDNDADTCMAGIPQKPPVILWSHENPYVPLIR
jgi:hypothetical protein